MGFLAVGAPFDWHDSREDGIIEYIRKHGVEQFLIMWDKVKNIDNKELKWGDETEYGVFVADEKNGDVKLSLRGAEILADLQSQELERNAESTGCAWVPEYGSWMVEGTPDRPYSSYASDLVTVENNMRLRRARLLSVLRPNEICPTVPCFPLMGVGDFTSPPSR